MNLLKENIKVAGMSDENVEGDNPLWRPINGKAKRKAVH